MKSLELVELHKGLTSLAGSKSIAISTVQICEYVERHATRVGRGEEQ